jgi:hypothetical protein
MYRQITSFVFFVHIYFVVRIEKWFEGTRTGHGGRRGTLENV